MHALMKPWLLVPVIAALLAAGQIWMSHLRYELSLHTQAAMADQKTVEHASSKLRIEIASLTRPERLRQYARNKLGMVPPGPMQVIHQ